MSRTESCGSSQTCPPTYVYQKHQGSCEPATEDKAQRDRVERSNAATARLDRLSGATAKYQGGQGVSPSPTLEQDPAVLRYRWSPEQRRYQVTKYDPEHVRFTRSGRPLTGPTVKLDNRPTRLDDAIDIVRGRAEARQKAVKVLEETPFGTKALLSKGQCRPVYKHLSRALQHTARAEALLRSGKGEEAKKALAAATTAYNDAAIKLNSAKRQIENNVELAVGVLKAIKAAGEVAEIGLMVVGAGAVGKGVKGLAQAAGTSDWVATGAKIVGSAAVKTTYAAADKVRDHLVFEPDKPIDWRKIGKDAGKNMLWNLVSGAVSNKVEGLIKNDSALEKLLARAGQKITKTVLKTAMGLMADQARRGARATPRQLVSQAMSETEAAMRQALTDEGFDVTKGTGKAILEALVKGFMEQ